MLGEHGADLADQQMADDGPFAFSRHTSWPAERMAGLLSLCCGLPFEDMRQWCRLRGEEGSRPGGDDDELGGRSRRGDDGHRTTKQLQAGWWRVSLLRDWASTGGFGRETYVAEQASLAEMGSEGWPTARRRAPGLRSATAGGACDGRPDPSLDARLPSAAPGEGFTGVRIGLRGELHSRVRARYPLDPRR
jgi:hypothetical protein